MCRWRVAQTGGPRQGCTARPPDPNPRPAIILTTLEDLISGTRFLERGIIVRTD